MSLSGDVSSGIQLRTIRSLIDFCAAGAEAADG